MKWQQIGDKWQQFAGSAKTRWEGDRLVRRIEEAYGVPREAEEQVEEWATRFREQEVRHS